MKQEIEILQSKDKSVFLVSRSNITGTEQWDTPGAEPSDLVLCDSSGFVVRWKRRRRRDKELKNDEADSPSVSARIGRDSLLCLSRYCIVQRICAAKWKILHMLHTGIGPARIRVITLPSETESC